MTRVNIPVGTSSFEEIRRESYYFVDKSGLIEELLKTPGTKVTLITRPRRFGKTLGMRMLSEFFDIRKDSRPLFSGLMIAENQEICKTWMNQYPTVFLSFRGVDGTDFEDAYAMLAAVIARLYKENLYLTEGGRVNSFDRELIGRLAAKQATREEVKNSLLTLTKLLADRYGRPVIFLLDEYDVPLAKASEKGYYPQMLDMLRGMMQAVKDNDSLKFAVVTGCLRIAKESIFTGTNNFVSDTITDTRLNEYFGFTQGEVDRLLADTGLTAHAAEIKEWYDGYRFGDFDVYCPWDVMNHVRNLLLDPASRPDNFWENTSDNSILRVFLDRADFDINDKFETLLAGGYIRETIEKYLTYDRLEASEENFWSLLYLTGYLTRLRPAELPGVRLLPGQLALKLPNAEITDIFKKSVKAWTAGRTEASNRKDLFAALWEGDERGLTKMLSDLLFDTISYHDYKESFYHAFLTGLFANAGFQVESNYESGLGRSDLVVKDRKNRRAVVIEAKTAGSEEELEHECEAALQQIENLQYKRGVERAGFKNVNSLGIAFWKKQCLVKTGTA